MAHFKWTMNPVVALVPLGKGHPDTLSWDSSPKTGHWGMDSNWQEDMSVEVAVSSWGQSRRVMASDQQPLGSFWQG